jgi:hypothetical protein
MSAEAGATAAIKALNISHPCDALALLWELRREGADEQTPTLECQHTNRVEEMQQGATISRRCDMDADKPMVHAAAVSFGGRLDPAARPFFVAGLLPMDELGMRLGESVGVALNVGELSPATLRFAEWFEAVARNDHRRFDEIEQELNAAGLGNNARAALAELVRFADVLRAIARLRNKQVDDAKPLKIQKGISQ